MSTDPGEFIARRRTDRIVEFEHPTGYGSMLVEHLPDQRTLKLYDMNVHFVFRNQGMGKDMLRYSLYVAECIGAATVTAAVNSREAYQAAASVFGEESLQVAQLGPFQEQASGDIASNAYRTIAQLHHIIDKT